MAKFIKSLGLFDITYFLLMAVAGSLVGTGLAHNRYVEALFGVVIAFSATVNLFLHKQEQVKGAQR